MTTFYHGSRHDLQVGSILLPPSRTMVKCCRDFGYQTHNRRRVYFTDLFIEAARYAMTIPIDQSETELRGAHGARIFCPPVGRVYTVVPIGPLRVDDDYTRDPGDLPLANPGALGWSAPAARIISFQSVPDSLVRERYEEHVACEIARTIDHDC